MTVEQVEYRHIKPGNIEFRLNEDDGTFEGFANLHGITDSFGTRFSDGSWRAGGLSSDVYAYLDMHDPTQRLGVFTADDQSQGLWIAGKYHDTVRGRDARTEARDGSAPELSVGFIRRGVDPDDPTLITAAQLVEVSQITKNMASQPGAELAAVRMAAAALGHCLECEARAQAEAAALAEDEDDDSELEVDLNELDEERERSAATRAATRLKLAQIR